MNKEDKKLQEDLVNEMIKVSKTNPDVMIYMQSLMKCYEDLEKENQQLKKQKDDVVEGLKDLRQFVYDELVDFNVRGATETHCKVMNLLRMLGEKDVKD